MGGHFSEPWLVAGREESQGLTLVAQSPTTWFSDLANKKYKIPSSICIWDKQCIILKPEYVLGKNWSIRYKEGFVVYLRFKFNWPSCFIGHPIL